LSKRQKESFRRQSYSLDRCEQVERSKTIMWLETIKSRSLFCIKEMNSSDQYSEQGNLLMGLNNKTVRRLEDQLFFFNKMVENVCQNWFLFQ
jgi:hypothetical protein